MVPGAGVFARCARPCAGWGCGWLFRPRCSGSVSGEPVLCGQGLAAASSDGGEIGSTAAFAYAAQALRGAARGDPGASERGAGRDDRRAARLGGSGTRHLGQPCKHVDDAGPFGADAQKKALHAAEQTRPDVAAARAEWAKQQPELDPARLVFLDETWTTTNMICRFGRSPRGERVIGAVPYGHWKTSTFVAALRHDGLTAPLVLDGAMNGEAFLAYVQQFLAPTLQPQDAVIMDNLPAHKVAGVHEAIEGAGARLLYTPAVQPGSEPNRTGLRQAEVAAAYRCLQNGRGAVDLARQTARRISSQGMRELFCSLRIQAERGKLS